MSASALQNRAESMLMGEGERPVTSGMPPAAKICTNALISAVKEAVSCLWKARRDEARSTPTAFSATLAYPSLFFPGGRHARPGPCRPMIPLWGGPN
jgi:hypothetical protein